MGRDANRIELGERLRGIVDAGQCVRVCLFVCNLANLAE